MKRLNRKTTKIDEKLAIKAIQFGEGNFLRAFVDYAFHTLNKECNSDIGVAVVQPIEHGLVDLLQEQEGLYTLFCRGFSDGKAEEEQHLISSIIEYVNPYKDYQSYLDLACLDSLEFVISNTTEAGITYNEEDALSTQPPNSFPAKLTALLYKRFKHFKGSSQHGLIIIPCELINYNADNLKTIILQYAANWSLGSEFKSWINDHNTFHNTLVDRIVPGYPKDDLATYQQKLTYDDKLIVTSELFFLWVIEGGEDLKKKLPFHKTKLDVKIVADMQPYRTRKVRILNGAHTSMVAFGILYGLETVKETIDNPFTGSFIKDLIFEEIIPTLDLDESELIHFAEAVLDRFRNPYIKHQLKSIALNSVSKFNVRVLPSIVQFVNDKGVLPYNLTFAFACLIRFYKGTWKGTNTPINDDQDIIDFFKQAWTMEDRSKMIALILSREDYWGQDLRIIPDLLEILLVALEEIEKNDIENAYNNYKNRF